MTLGLLPPLLKTPRRGRVHARNVLHVLYMLATLPLFTSYKDAVNVCVVQSNACSSGARLQAFAPCKVLTSGRFTGEEEDDNITHV